MALSASELRLAIRLLPLLEQRRESIAATLAQASRNAGSDPGAGALWAHLYELPLRQHLARAAVAFDMDRELIAAARGELPMSALIDALERVDDEVVEPPEAARLDIVGAGWAAYGYAHSLQCALKAMLVFGRPLNSLIESARVDGDDRALLNAIRIDPTVLSGRTGALRLARACLHEDRKFLAGLRRALDGALGKREQARLLAARNVLRVLAQTGAARLGDAGLASLYARLARLYPAALKRRSAARELRSCAARFILMNSPQATAEPAAPSRAGKRG